MSALGPDDFDLGELGDVVERLVEAGVTIALVVLHLTTMAALCLAWKHVDNLGVHALMLVSMLFAGAMAVSSAVSHQGRGER